MKLRSVLLAATILAAPLVAKADPIDGLYVGAGAGFNYLENTDFKGFQPVGGVLGATGTAVGSSKLTYEGGFVGLGSVGYGLGNGLRFEVEGNYRYNNVNKWTGTNFPTSAGGHNQTFGALVNALYDFDLGWPIIPYIGAGVGYGWTDLQSVSATGTSFGTGRAVYVQQRTNQTEGNFAYQAIAGFAYPIDAVPGLAVTAEYRFYSVIGSTSFKGSVSAISTTAYGQANGKFKLQDQYNQAVLLGVRYAFNAAPPPPPPAPVVAPAPQPARSYLVFFDWDKYNLTDRARQIIREAADNSTHVQYTKIAVNGYADTTGTAKYNMALSIRRAQAVAAELVKDGVPKSAIAIQGFGDTVLLVPTGPQVREPQNRRVEIIIQ